jgi:hypothetical protein
LQHHRKNQYPCFFIIFGIELFIENPPRCLSGQGRLTLPFAYLSADLTKKFCKAGKPFVFADQENLLGLQEIFVSLGIGPGYKAFVHCYYSFGLLFIDLGLATLGRRNSLPLLRLRLWPQHALVTLGHLAEAKQAAPMVLAADVPPPWRIRATPPWEGN